MKQARSDISGYNISVIFAFHYPNPFFQMAKKTTSIPESEVSGEKFDPQKHRNPAVVHPLATVRRGSNGHTGDITCFDIEADIARPALRQQSVVEQELHGRRSGAVTLNWTLASAPDYV